MSASAFNQNIFLFTLFFFSFLSPQIILKTFCTYGTKSSTAARKFHSIVALLAYIFFYILFIFSHIKEIWVYILLIHSSYEKQQDSHVV